MTKPTCAMCNGPKVSVGKSEFRNTQSMWVWVCPLCDLARKHAEDCACLTEAGPNYFRIHPCTIHREGIAA